MICEYQYNFQNGQVRKKTPVVQGGLHVTLLHRTEYGPFNPLLKENIWFKSTFDF